MRLLCTFRLTSLHRCPPLVSPGTEGWLLVLCRRWSSSGRSGTVGYTRALLLAVFASVFLHPIPLPASLIDVFPPRPLHARRPIPDQCMPYLAFTSALAPVNLRMHAFGTGAMLIVTAFPAPFSFRTST
ncbi:hypothetical protein MSAN_02285100 [Mycena sanguinolenta]|uniref:Uncharacterized protein n=1 Tax=Mycena sanguinolenta TaxID=230812 RepID=A0A8H6X9N1_9AGAR|nr:hypothetical protein MSAN_02285100 [Mycena sanguinolenta]